MRINYLDPEGDLIGHSSEFPASRWREVVMEIMTGKLEPLSPDEQAEVDAEAFRAGADRDEEEPGPRQMDIHDANVVAAYLKLIKPGVSQAETDELYEIIQSGCISSWLTDPTVLQDFEKNANTMNGFVKITLTGLETGWMQRSQ